MNLSQDPLPGTAPCVPPGTRIYVVGDIHGRLDLFDAMLQLIHDDLKATPHQQPDMILLGDYVDRGSQSAGVVQRLLELVDAYGVTCLRGNHEAMLTTFLERPRIFEQWRAIGGTATLSSYGVVPPPRRNTYFIERMAADLYKAMPQAHRVFLESLPLTCIAGDYLFVHAGLRPGRSLAQQVEPDLLWIRDEFLNCDHRFEKFVVHGHTPVAAVDVRANRINVDTGAFATGCLSCLVLEDDRRRFLRTTPARARTVWAGMS